ncbi:MAG: hypothetical protein ACLGGX_11685 [Bdellovibrionia bacterium]
MLKTFIQLTLAIILFPQLLLANNILFEGYHKVYLQDKHIGFTVSRYEFDAKTQKFKSTYFLKTHGTGADITESLKALSNKDLSPVSYEYTSLVGKDSKVIDAKMQKESLVATLRENGKAKTIRTQVPKGSFLSSFLIYLILQNPKGLQAETNYQYQAIAEEDGQLHKGEALFGKEEVKNGFKVFKALNTFKDSKFISYVSPKGEIIGTEIIGAGLKTELSTDLASAAGEIPKSESLLKTLFGTLPVKSSPVQ